MRLPIIAITLTALTSTASAAPLLSPHVPALVAQHAAPFLAAAPRSAA